MKAIETHYKGYRFRSRLEARWAVFLDALGVTWSYEKEGYKLDGVWYLPDFFVNDWECWIEIKGQSPTPDELTKCEKLARDAQKVVLLIAGDPWTSTKGNEYDVTLFEYRDSKGAPERWQSSGWEFGQGRRNDQEIWLVSDELGAFALKGIPHEGDHKYPLSGTYATRVVSALTAARSARFEHGEKP